MTHGEGHFEKAKEQILRAVSIWEKNPDKKRNYMGALTNLGNLAGSQSDYKEAIRIYEQVIAEWDKYMEITGTAPHPSYAVRVTSPFD